MKRETTRTTSGKGSRKWHIRLAANSSEVRWNPFAAEASKSAIPCIGRTSDKSEKRTDAEEKKTLRHNERSQIEHFKCNCKCVQGKGHV